MQPISCTNRVWPQYFSIVKSGSSQPPVNSLRNVADEICARPHRMSERDPICLPSWTVTNFSWLSVGYNHLTLVTVQHMSKPLSYYTNPDRSTPASLHQHSLTLATAERRYHLSTAYILLINISSEDTRILFSARFFLGFISNIAISSTKKFLFGLVVNYKQICDGPHQNQS